MPKEKYLQNYEKGQIDAYYEEGKRIREIARKMKRSHNVVRNYLEWKKEYGTKMKGGPKEKLSQRDLRKLSRLVSNKKLSAKLIIPQMSKKVSQSTVYRKMHFLPYIKREKPISVPF